MSYNIIIFEKSGDLLYRLNNEISDLGYNIKGIFNDTNRFPENIESSMPDLILMNITLSGKYNGNNITQEIGLKYNVPVVFLVPDNTNKDQLESAGILKPYEFINENFTRQELYLTIEFAISEHINKIKEKEVVRKLYNSYKGLDCLCKVSDIIDTPNIALSQIFMKTIKVIMSSMQYTDTACTCIEFDNRIYKYDDFDQSNEAYYTPVYAHKNERGRIKIYSKKFKGIGEKFKLVDEEMQLIQIVAERLGRAIERIELHEQKDRNKEVFSETIISSMNEGLIVFDRDLRCITWNNYMEKITGTLSEEIIGNSIFDMHPSLLGEEAETLLNEALKGKSVASTDKEYHVTATGKQGWFKASYSPLVDENKEIIGVIGIINEITEQKIAEKQLLEKEEFFRQMFENHSAVKLIISPDENGRIVDANKAAVNFYGYSHDTITKMTITDINIDPEIDILTEMETVSSEEKSSLHQKHKLANGQIRDVNVFSGPVDSNGKKLLFYIIFDITEKRISEQRLIESEERFENLFNLIDDPIFIYKIGSQNTIVELLNFNSSAYLYLNYTEKQLENIFIDKIDMPLTSSSIGKYYDTIHYKKNGEKIYVEISSMSMDFENEKIIIAIVRDITIRKNKENLLTNMNIALLRKYKERTIELENTISFLEDEIDQRNKAERELEQSLKEKDILIKEVHHRVKNNMQFISSLVELRLNYISDENSYEILKEMQNRIAIMGIIHQKLYQTESYIHLNVEGYIKDLVREIISSYNSLGINLSTDISINNDIELNFSKLIFIGVAVNEVLSNSLKYAFVNRSDGNIKINFYQENEKNILVIKDDGIGLPDGFDINNSRTFGFSLIKSLTRRHKGSISQKSDNGTEIVMSF